MSGTGERKRRVRVKAFYSAPTCSFSYVLHDAASRVAAIVDPVLELDEASEREHPQRLEPLLRYIRGRSLKVDWLLETHLHADHVSAGWRLKTILGGRTAIGAGVEGLAAGRTDVFDLMLEDGQELPLGGSVIRVMAAPGHTPCSVVYLCEGWAFVGDTLFMPDFGTGRCDFPGGSARALYRSIQRIYALPADTRLMVCHDSTPPRRRGPRCRTSVAAQRASNIHLREGVGEEEFVRLRDARDKALRSPRLMHLAVPANLGLGRPAP